MNEEVLTHCGGGGAVAPKKQTNILRLLTSEGFHGGDDEDLSLLGCYAVSLGKLFATFGRVIQTL